MKQYTTSILLFIMLYAYSQNHLKGRIIDSHSSNSISNVNIYIPELNKGTTTDDLGHFMFQDLPTGNFEFIFSSLGYSTLKQQITIPSSLDLSLELNPSIIEINEIVLSTPFHKLQSENIVKVDQINFNTLENSSGLNLSAKLESVPGVSAITTGAGIGKPVIRGLSGNRIVTYTQGIRLENQQFGDEHDLGIIADGVQNIEIIKGPASLLYGSDAIGGVLYFNPEKFSSESGLKADLKTRFNSNTNGFSSSVGLKQSFKNLKFIARGSTTSFADYQTPQYYVTNSRFKSTDFKGAIGYERHNFKSEFRYNLNSSKLGIPELIGIQNRNTTPLLPYQEVETSIFSNKTTFDLNNTSKLEWHLGYTSNKRKEFEDHEDDEESSVLEPALFMTLNTFSGDLKYYLPKKPKLESIVGIQMLNQSNTNFGEEQLIPDANTNDFGAFATSHLHFERIDLQMGVRFDHRTLKIKQENRLNFSSFNGSVGLKTTVLKSIETRINFATGFRAPTLAELTSEGSHEGANRYEIGSLDLKQEQNFQLDLNLEQNSDHFGWFANGFFNTISNYIYLNPRGTTIDNNPVYDYKQTNALLYGGEFGVHLHPHPLDWLHLESTLESVSGIQRTTKQPLPLIPALSTTQTIRTKFYENSSRSLSAFARLKSYFEQNKISDFETKTPAYSLVDFGINGRWFLTKIQFEFQCSISNVFDKQYTHHLSRLKADGIFNAGRSFNFGVGLKF